MGVSSVLQHHIRDQAVGDAAISTYDSQCATSNATHQRGKGISRGHDHFLIDHDPKVICIIYFDILFAKFYHIVLLKINHS